MIKFFFFSGEKRSQFGPVVKAEKSWTEVLPKSLFNNDDDWLIFWLEAGEGKIGNKWNRSYCNGDNVGSCDDHRSLKWLQTSTVIVPPVMVQLMFV